VVDPPGMETEKPLRGFERVVLNVGCSVVLIVYKNSALDFFTF